MIPPGDEFNAYNPPAQAPISWTEAWTKALISPSEETFRRIGYSPNASFGRAALWIFFATLIGMIISVPLTLALNPAQLAPLQEMLGGENSALAGALGLMACFVPMTALFAVIGSVIGTGLYQLIARLLGGEGDFNALYNATAAFSAPMGIVASIISAIPIVGACISFLLSLYSIVLSVIAIQAINRFGYGKAIITVLIPLFVVGLCCCLAVFAFSAALAPILGVDPSQWQQLLTPVP